MFNILGMIILIIILFIIILLAIGVKISFEYEKRGSKLTGCLKILILKKIKIFSHEFPSSPEEKKDEKDEDEKKNRDIRKLFELARPCFKDFMEFFKSFLKCNSIRRFDNHLIFGMDSFADTGKYIGIIWAVLSAVNPMHEKLKLSAEPSFNGSVLDGYGVNEIEFYPLKIIVPSVRLLLKKDVRIFIRGVLDER